jgi:hypothetical protein
MTDLSEKLLRQNHGQRPGNIGPSRANHKTQADPVQQKCINHNKLEREMTVSLEHTIDRGPNRARPPLIVASLASNICRAIAAEPE